MLKFEAFYGYADKYFFNFPNLKRLEINESEGKIDFDFTLLNNLENIYI